MKKFRILTVLALAISMLFVVAAAADCSFDAVTYDGSADTISVAIKATGDYTIDMYSAFQLMYDEAVLAVDTDASAAASTTYAMSFYDYTGDMGYGAVAFSNEGGDLAVTKDSTIAVVVFNVLDKAAVAGKEIAWDEAGTMVFNVGEMLDFTGAVAITGAAAKEDPTYVASVNPKATFDGATDIYTGVWVGAYTVALKGNTANVVTVDFDTDHSYAVETNAAGEGSIAFKIAVLGAPVDAVGTPVLDGVAAIAE